ncbi:WD40 repeat protein [Catenulispora sp. GP43]|uniref:hypothetical protein n=1 Tax=Catenulispora sp. GP43 TaxID=3156263 RepID=UPI003515C586
MATRPDSGQALRDWAAAHARTVGRSGVGPAPLTALNFTLKRKMFIGEDPDDPVSVAWIRHQRQLQLIVLSDFISVWDEEGSFLREVTMDETLGFNRPADVLGHFPTSDLVALNDDYGEISCVVEPESGSLFMGEEMSTTWWRDPHFTLGARGVLGGAISVAISYGGSQIKEDRLIGQHPDASDLPWMMDWLPGPGLLPRLVAIDGVDGLHVFDMITLKPARVLEVAGASALACAPDSDRSTLAVGDMDGVIHLVDVDAGTVVHTLSQPDNFNSVNSLSWSPDPLRPLLAAGTEDGTVRLWSPDSGRCLAVLEHPEAITSVALTIDDAGRMLLATGCEDGNARIWVSDTSAPQSTASFPTGAADGKFTLTERATTVTDTQIMAMAWEETSDGARLFTAGTIGSAFTIDATMVETRDTAHNLIAEVHKLEAKNTGIRALTSRHRAGRSLLATVDATRQAASVRVREYGDSIMTTYEERSPHSGDDIHIAWSQDRTWPLLAIAQPGSGEGDGGTDLSIRSSRGWGPASRGRHTDWRVTALSWSHHQVKPSLAIGGKGGHLSIWTPDDGRKPSLEYEVSGSVTHLGWSPDGERPLLAVATAVPHAVEIWDPDARTRIRTLLHPNDIKSIAWWQSRDGLLLCTMTGGGFLRLWEPVTGECVYNDNTLPVSRRTAALHPEDHRLWLASDTHSGLRIYELALKNTDAPPSGPYTPPPATLWAAAHGLVSLGAGGLWTPLGVLADTLALLASDRPRLHDPRLAPLAGHQGLAKLRSLRWPAPARVGLAALLLAAQHAAERAAPTGTAPGAQVEALVKALATAVGPVSAGSSPVGALTEAADAVSDKTLTLLRILGPEAVAADPILPLRLSAHVPELPDLPPQHTTVLHSDELIRRHDSTDRAATPGITPGVAGVSRHGPLHAALPTQLALPDDLRLVRYARGELLHRTHPAHRPPPSRSVAMVLDTTPATFGRCEALLRLAAHLVTSIVWRAGHTPSLVTLTDPDRARELAEPEDLLAVWTSRTLEPPDFRRALKTAEGTAKDLVVILTNSHAVRDRLMVGRTTLGSRYHLLTAHTPTSAPPPAAVHPNHRQLLTTTSSDRLIAVLSAILAQNPEAAR